MARTLIATIPSTRENLIINGNMDFWQRDTSFVSLVGGQYTADRFFEFKNASAFAGGVTRQAEDIPGIGNTYTLQVARNPGNTDTSGHFLSYLFEQVDTQLMRNRTFTLSFYARSGSGYTPIDENLRVRIQASNQGEFDNLTFTVDHNLVDQNASLNNATMERFSYTFTVPSDATQLRIRWISEHQGTAPSNDSYRIGAIMLHEGGVVAPFRRYGTDYGRELLACQRYFEKSYAVDTSIGATTDLGSFRQRSLNNTSSGAITDNVQFKVSKRAVPDVEIYSPATGAAGQMNREGVGDITGLKQNIGTYGFHVRNNVTAPTPESYEWHFSADAEL